MEGLQDKYFVDRFGHSNRKKISECINVWDYMGFVEINITKKKSTSFRCDYDDKLYKSIPDDWQVYSEKNLMSFSIVKIANVVCGNYMSTFFERTRKAITLMDKTQKQQLAILIESKISRDCEMRKKRLFKEVNGRICDCMNGYNEPINWVEENLPENEEE